MAKATKEKEKPAKRKVKKIDVLPLEAVNYKILIAGVVVVVLGYIALAMEPWDGFMALTAAPILLVIGYCIIIPVGIMFRKKMPEVAPAMIEQPAEPAAQN